MQTPFPAYQGEDAYFFVCYAHEDTGAVLPELQRLHDLGFNIWYDEGISPGHEWTEEIATAISGATEFLYFVSGASVSSRNCRNELQFATSRDKAVIAVHIEPTELPGGVELAIGLSQAIHRYDINDETFIRKLTANLTAPVSADRSEVFQKKGRKLSWLGGSFAAVVLLVSLAGVWWLWDPESNHQDVAAGTRAPISSPSIAVLPFANLSSDPEQSYFSNGVAEEVLNLLAESSGIKVISRSSSFSFVGQTLGLPEIAGRLGVNHILQGSVRKSGSTVRIAVQLVDVQTDTYLWSRSYDRQLDDIFAVQDEIAQEVAAALNVVLAGVEFPGSPRNTEAYGLYLRARHTLGVGATDENLKVAERQLKQALALEPEYVAAWRELGRVYLQQVGNGIISGEESTRLRWDAISKALEIDPDDAVSNAYRGFQEVAVNGDLEAAARRFEKAIRRAPRHEDVLRPMMLFMLELDRVSEAVPFAELAVERDPLCGYCLLNLGNIYLMLGRPDDAEQTFQTASTVLTDSNDVLGFQARLELGRGQPERALDLFGQLPEHYPSRHGGEAISLHRMGRIPEFEEKVAYVKSRWPDRPFALASIHAAIGDPDTAFTWLARGMDETTDRVPRISGLPRPAAWMPYWDDQRWQDYLAAIDRSPERLRAVEFNP